MANQNPQPEIYTTTHSFASGATAGTQNIQTVYTNQSTSEEVRIYGLSVNIYNSANGTSLAGVDDDFDLRIKIGNGYVPTQAFDLSVIHQRDDRTITFPTPILVLFQQPISVEVSWRGGYSSTITEEAVKVKVSLHAELALAQVACMQCGMEHPREMGCPVRRNA